MDGYIAGFFQLMQVSAQISIGHTQQLAQIGEIDFIPSSRVTRVAMICNRTG
jgi:hypothetical protein